MILVSCTARVHLHVKGAAVGDFAELQSPLATLAEQQHGDCRVCCVGGCGRGGPCVRHNRRSVPLATESSEGTVPVQVLVFCVMVRCHTVLLK